MPAPGPGQVSLEDAAAALKEVLEDSDAFVDSMGVEEVDKRIDDAEAALAKDAEDGSQSGGDTDIAAVRKHIEECKVISDKHHGTVDGSAVFVDMDKNATGAWFGPPALKTTSINDMQLQNGATPDELVDHLHGHLPSFCGRHVAVLLSIIAFLTPLAAAIFMMHASYTAYGNHHRCTGLNLLGLAYRAYGFWGSFGSCRG